MPSNDVSDGNWIVSIAFRADAAEQARLVARAVADAAGILPQVDQQTATYAPIGDEGRRSPVYDDADAGHVV